MQRLRPITSRPRLDPATLDWTWDRGRLKEDETHLSTVLFLIAHQRGTSCAFPDVGSRFYTIKKILPNTPRDVEIMTIEALDPLIQPRKITQVKATATRVGPVTIALRISWQDTRGKYNAIRRLITIGVQQIPAR
jgi:phage gp46-like protein